MDGTASVLQPPLTWIITLNHFYNAMCVSSASYDSLGIKT